MPTPTHPDILPKAVSVNSSVPASIAIRTSFAHHATHAGYKQILRFTKPQVILGVDEHRLSDTSPLKQRYHFLMEWEAKAYASRHKVDLLHILYGEEYFRFSTRLMKELPVIATFHQPPEVLQQEIERGDMQGTVGRITHLLNPDRFAQLSAAIVMTEAQRTVLAQAMPAERVHVIPLGADLKTLTNYYNNIQVEREAHQLLTVGNWMRDWDFYVDFVAHCLEQQPGWQFVLVNRKLPDSYREILANYPNVEIKADVSDEDLYHLYCSSTVQFLAFSGAAGNNSMNEGLAMGCPVVTNILNTSYQHSEEIIAPFESGSFESARLSCEQLLNRMQTQSDRLSQLAQEAVLAFDWSTIGQQTLHIYHQVL